MQIRLHHILFLGFTLISMVPVIFLAWWMQQSALDKEIEAVEEKHLLVARNLTGALSRYITDVEASFELAAIMLEPGRQTDGIEGMLDAVYFKHVFLADASGQIIKATAMNRQDLMDKVPERIMTDLAPIFEQARSRPGKIIFSDLMLDFMERPSIFLVRYQGGERFIIGALGTEYIVEIQRSVAFGRRGHAAIVDRQGRTMAHPLAEWRETMKDISFLPPVRQMMLGQSGVIQFYTPAMQADMIAGYTTAKGIGWGIMVPQPFEELVEKAEGVVQVAFGVALIGVIVAAAISWWLAGYLVRPISAVVGSARTAGQDLLSFDPPRLGRLVPQELRQLVVSFNHMVEQINAKNLEVKKGAARLAEAQRIAGLGNWEWDAPSDRLWCSDEMSRIFEQETEKLSGSRKKILGLIHADDREAAKKAMDETLATGLRSAIDLRIPMPSGGEKVAHLQMVAQESDLNEGEPWLVGTLHDITAAKKYEERLIYQANYDELTDLPNRTLFLDRLTHALLAAKRSEGHLGLLFIDLDNFKEVNDTLGHTNGDNLLKQASLRLRDCVRDNDTVARLSGDEFTVILENTQNDRDVAVVAEKIIVAMAKPFRIDGYEVLVGASIGISLYPNDGADTATMLGNADIAMFRAKDQGRNSYCFFTTSMNEEMMHNMKLGNDLRNALKRNEFSVYYQPVVDVESNRIIAAEALVRWDHPDRGHLLPNVFIPLAEERGFIGPLGEWVLRSACREAVRWSTELSDPPNVSVNLSIRQIKLGLNRDIIANLLQECNLDASQLTFEITESLVMEDSSEAIAWLEQVKSLGVRFSIDDFGTGYSSLSYLKRLPVDILKIDRAFVSDLNAESGNKSLIESIIALAGNFGLGVIAEGVEDEEQLEFLRLRGCRMLQGYLFSRPLPADDFLVLLKNWRNDAAAKRP